MGLLFTIAAGPRQRSHSRVRVPWDSRPYFTVSASRLPLSSPVLSFVFSFLPPHYIFDYLLFFILNAFPDYDSFHLTQALLWERYFPWSSPFYCTSLIFRIDSSKWVRPNHREARCQAFSGGCTQRGFITKRLCFLPQSRSEFLYDWRFTAYQFVLAKTHLRSMTRIFIYKLSTWSYSSHVTSSLTRGWVRRLQFLLGLVSAVILRSQSHGTCDYICCLRFESHRNTEGQVPVFISPRNTVAQL
jgi:hypothetical protein